MPGSDYPSKPGFYDSGYSEEAAALIESKAATLRGKVVAVLKRHPSGLTPDQVAHEMSESILSIRPRVTELRIAGIIEDVPDGYGINASGRRAQKVRLRMTDQKGQLTLL
jgi:hypothetical protein